MEIPSSDLTLVLTGAVVVLSAYSIWRSQHSRNDYPQGPFRFPILGNLPQMVLSKSVGECLKNCRKKYGNIFTLEFGGSKRVVISGYQNIYDILVTNADISSNRSVKSFPKRLAEMPPGLLWTAFPHWKTIRSFSMGVMKDEGMGKQVLEPKVLDEIDRFCAHYLDPNIGQQIDLSKGLSKAACNVVSELIFGGRGEYEDASFEEMMNNVDQLVKGMMKAGVTKNVPFASHFKFSGIEEFSKATFVLLPEMVKRISDHRKDLDPTQPRDIFDAFLIHQSKFGEMEGTFADTNAANTALQLYVAGTETTATAIRWALLYTCLNPGVKTKVREEIHKEIGERPVSYKDRTNMPYTEAVLLETLRLADIVPHSLPHLLDKALEIDGVVIPAGADLMLNVASVLHDDDVFEDPLKFKPERYLTGDIALKKRRTIPFGIGRRICLGESLARMEFFMFYVTLMQKYNINLSVRSSNLSTEPVSGVVNYPQAFDLEISPSH